MKSFTRTAALILLLGAGWTPPAEGAPPAPGTAVLTESAARELFQGANREYRAGHYDRAFEEYQRLYASGRTGGSVLYNLGSAAFQLKDWKRAIYFYRRAQYLYPRDRALRDHLARALNARDASRALSAPWVRWRRWGYIGGLFLWPSAVFFALYGTWWVLGILRLWVDRPWLKWLWRVFPGLIAAAALIWGAQQVHLGRAYGVVLADRVAIRSLPGEEGQELFSLNGGQEVLVEEPPSSRTAWMKIRTSDGLRGWAPASEVGLVRAPGS